MIRISAIIHVLHCVNRNFGFFKILMQCVNRSYSLSNSKLIYARNSWLGTLEIKDTLLHNYHQRLVFVTQALKNHMKVISYAQLIFTDN